MDINTALILLQDGITSGAVYVLLAVALVMVFTVTRIVLVSQGEFIVFTVLTVAAYQQGLPPGAVWIVAGAAVIAAAMEAAVRLRERSYSGLAVRALVLLVIPLCCAGYSYFGVDKESPYWLQCASAVALVTSMGPAIYRIAFKPLAEATPLILLIAAIALHLLLLGLGLVAFGPEGSRLPEFAFQAPHIGSWTLNAQGIVVVSISAAMIGVLYLLFNRTLLGKALRATAVSRTGAQLVGVSPGLAGELSLTLAALIGAASGILIGPVTTIYYDSGFLLGLKGFVGAIVGGLGGYGLAAIGSLAVGLMEAFASFWASPYKEIIVFTLIVPVLMWRSVCDPHAQDEEQ